LRRRAPVRFGRSAVQCRAQKLERLRSSINRMLPSTDSTKTACLGRYRGWIGPQQPGWSAQVLDFLKLDVGRGTHVFLKPNLTWKKHVAGVTTSPVFLRELVHEL